MSGSRRLLSYVFIDSHGFRFACFRFPPTIFFIFFQKTMYPSALVSSGLATADSVNHRQWRRWLISMVTVMSTKQLTEVGTAYSAKCESVLAG